MIPHLYALPAEPAVSYPVEEDRLLRTLKALGYAIECGDTDTPQVNVDGVPFRIAVDPRLRFFSLRTTWKPGVDFSTHEEALFAIADTWNRERYFPSIYLVQTADGNVEVIIDYAVDCQDGLTDQQLCDALRVAFQTGPDAVFYIQDAAGHLLGIGHESPILPE